MTQKVVLENQLSGQNVTHLLIYSVEKVVKDWSNVDISETVKYRNATPSALKLFFYGA